MRPAFPLFALWVASAFAGGCGASTPGGGEASTPRSIGSSPPGEGSSAPAPAASGATRGRVECTARRSDPEAGDFELRLEIEGRRVVAATFHSGGDWGAAEGKLPAPVEMAADGFTRLKLAVTYRLAQEPEVPREDSREFAFLVEGDALRFDDGISGRCAGRLAPGGSGSPTTSVTPVPPLVGSGGAPPPAAPPPPPATLLVLRGSENDLEIQLSTVAGPLGRHLVKAEARVEVPVPPGRLGWAHLESNCNPSGVLEIREGATVELVCWHSARSGDCCALGGPAYEGTAGRPVPTPADEVAEFLHAWNVALDARDAKFFAAHAQLPLSWSTQGEAGTTTKRFTRSAQLAAAGSLVTIDPGFVEAITIDPARGLARHGICPAETGIAAGSRPAITLEGDRARVAWLGGRCGQYVHLVVLELARADKSWRVVGQRVE